MKEEIIEQYYKNLIKLEKGEWANQQWYEYCSLILSDLMEENKDIFIRLKNR